jgi:hypothetical protein
MDRSLEQWTQRFIRGFAPLQKQESRVILYTVLSCLRRFPELPISMIYDAARNAWSHYLKTSNAGQGVEEQ